MPEKIPPIRWDCILIWNSTSASLATFGSSFSFQTGGAVHFKYYVSCFVLIAVSLYGWQEVKDCIVFKGFSSLWLHSMDQCSPINNKDIYFWFCLNVCNISLKYRCQLRLLAIVQPSILTQWSRKCLVLMLEKFLQITFSSFPSGLSVLIFYEN